MKQPTYSKGDLHFKSSYHFPSLPTLDKHHHGLVPVGTSTDNKRHRQGPIRWEASSSSDRP